MCESMPMGGKHVKFWAKGNSVIGNRIRNWIKEDQGKEGEESEKEIDAEEEGEKEMREEKKRIIKGIIASEIGLDKSKEKEEKKNLI